MQPNLQRSKFALQVIPQIAVLRHSLRLRQFVKFCLVGGSGVVVDMALLYFLASPGGCGWNLSLSKFCSAETAMLNNFLWNEVWTFSAYSRSQRGNPGVLRRLCKFHVICGIGLGWAVFLLNLFYVRWGMNLYAANLAAIALVTLWNFWLNALFNWRIKENCPVRHSARDLENETGALPRGA